MKIYLKTNALYETRNKLNNVNNDMVYELKTLSNCLRNSSWNDNLNRLTKELLNKHIKVMNEVFCDIDSVSECVRKIEEKAEEYLEFGR